MIKTFEDLNAELKREENYNKTGPCVLCGQVTYSRCLRCKKHCCEEHGSKECITPRDVYVNKLENRRKD